MFIKNTILDTVYRKNIIKISKDFDEKMLFGERLYNLVYNYLFKKGVIG